jgi:hypothetical protein
LQYFKGKSLPSSAYWLGIVKNGTEFVFADGTTLPQNVSELPYAHWWAAAGQGARPGQFWRLPAFLIAWPRRSEMVLYWFNSLVV